MSQFINHTDDYSSEFTTGIDFDDAVKLPGGARTWKASKTSGPTTPATTTSSSTRRNTKR